MEALEVLAGALIEEELEVAQREERLSRTAVRNDGGAMPSEEAMEDNSMKAKAKAGPGSLFGCSVTSVIRWMGKDDFSFAEARGALSKMKVSPMPTEACTRTFLYAGKKGERGDPAKLTAEQQRELRDAAKEVQAELKAETEKRQAEKEAAKANGKPKAKKAKAARKKHNPKPKAKATEALEEATEAT